MIYLFDTNVALAYLRQASNADKVTQILSLTDHNQILISVVTAGELWSIAHQNKWGSAKTVALHELLKNYIGVNIADDELIQRYAAIDAFSQNRIVGRPLTGSSRNMGKNALWIAAPASLAGASLITTDKDFDHLHGEFIDVLWINPIDHS